MHKVIPALRGGLTVVRHGWARTKNSTAKIAEVNPLRCSAECDSQLDRITRLPAWPKDLSDRTIAGRRNLIAIIEREVRKQRRLGRSRNRAYDIAHHAALVRLLKNERQALMALVGHSR